MRKLLLLFLFSYSCNLLSQIQFADVVLDASYSGANPNFNSFYGNNGLTDGCNIYPISLTAVLGDSDSIVAIPTDSYITLGFTDNLIFDAVNQDDLFVEENGGGQEFGNLYVSPDGINFTYLDTINGSQINSFDLSDYLYNDVVKAVKIVGLDNGGCVPGLDIERVYGVEGANCPCGTDLADFPEAICAAIDTSLVLDSLVLDTTNGTWFGPATIDNVFNPKDLASDVTEVELLYVVNIGHPVCPVDSISYSVKLATCDCNQVVNGSALIDDCSQCLEENDVLFNETCKDCNGTINGLAVVDSCGQCLLPSDSLYNVSCLDCNGDLNGPAVMDLCDQCLEIDDPAYNQNCPERFKVYVPNVFDVNGFGLDREFGLLSSKENLGFIRMFNIYDKWGALVFSLTDEKVREVTSWWDGTFNNRQLLSGVYTYRYIIEYPEFGEEADSGTVVLIR